MRPTGKLGFVVESRITFMRKKLPKHCEPGGNLPVHLAGAVRIDHPDQSATAIAGKMQTMKPEFSANYLG